MQGITEEGTRDEGTGVGDGGENGASLYGGVHPVARGGVNPMVRYIQAKAAMMVAQSEMAEAWEEMNREQRLTVTSPGWGV